MLQITPITSANRPLANALLTKRWGGVTMVLRGKTVSLEQADGFLAWDGGQLAGLVTYEIQKDGCEILSLDSVEDNRGTGTALLREVASAAEQAGCRRLFLITTNDNIRALRFYQRRGFDMVAFYRNAMDLTRRIKPSVPLFGDNGIPLKHEIEFELPLPLPDRALE